MRTGAARGHQGYFHEAALYSSDDELLEIVIPFLAEGVAAGEPTLVVLGEQREELVRRAMSDDCGVVFMSSTQYTRPASAIKRYRELLAGHVAAGARQIRAVGEVPHPGTGAPWGWWSRYEAAVNHAYQDFPLWGVCPYDTRVTPDEVLEDVVRTHPRFVTADGRHVPNARYELPVDFLVRPASVIDSLELSPPVLELTDPLPAVARHAVIAASGVTCLDTGQVDDMVFAASEVVSNALRYGRHPVRLRLWTAPDRLVLTVTDQGKGPDNPFVGFLPEENTCSAGFGLWITNQICDYVELDRTEDGFTVRLVVGTPHLVSRPSR